MEKCQQLLIGMAKGERMDGPMEEGPMEEGI
jgi:hypothetical protein